MPLLVPGPDAAASSWPTRRPRLLHPPDDPFAEDEPLPDDPAELASLIRSLQGLVRTQGLHLTQLRAAPAPRPPAFPPDPSLGSDAGLPAGTAAGGVDGGWAPFILTLDGAAYLRELKELVGWVDGFLLRTFGREVTATRPWCRRWPEHPEAVARLHALWLAYGQHLDEEAGAAGMAVWIRDILDHALVQLRAPDGTFAACATGLDSTNHRLLAPPGDTVLPVHTDVGVYAAAA